MIKLELYYRLDTLFHILIKFLNIASKFLVILSIQDRVDDTVGISDNMCNVVGYLTEVFITIVFEVDQ